MLQCFFEKRNSSSSEAFPSRLINKKFHYLLRKKKTKTNHSNLSNVKNILKTKFIGTKSFIKLSVGHNENIITESCSVLVYEL